MRAGFTQHGRVVRVVVQRDDGVVLETTTSKPKGALLPHDMEHFVVENAVGLKAGLWGRIAAGAEFDSFAVTRSRPRRRPRAQAKALTRGMSGWDENVIGVATEAYRAARAAGWAPPDRLPAALPIERLLRRSSGTTERDLTRADLEAACLALHDACTAWEKCPHGETLTLEWTSAARFPSSRRHR